MKYSVEHTKDGRRFSETIDAISFWDAEIKAEALGLKELEVMGVIVMVIPTKEDGVTPDFENAIDYDKERFN